MTQNKDALQIFDNGKTVWDNNYQFTTTQINKIRQALQSQRNAGAVDVDDLTDELEVIIGETHDVDIQDRNYAVNVVDYLTQNNHLKTSDTIVIDRADKLKIALMNIVYEWGSGVGYCESRMNDHIKHAALIAAEME